MSATTLSPRVEALDVFVDLLSGIDAPDAHNAFYGRICEAVSRLTSMERVILFLFDEAAQRVRATGSHGIEPALLGDLHGTLEETPVAQRALAEDRVIEISDRLEHELPPRYARLLPITTLTCTPLSAGGRWLGVIFADRGGGRFALTADERHVLWTLGKTAALAASARIATRQQERTRGLADRIDLARDIHDRVIQRLFGVLLALSAEAPLAGGARERMAEELREALGELRSALRRPLAPRERTAPVTLAEEIERLRRRHPRLPVTVEWEQGVSVPASLEPLAQSVLHEALRNADRHADPSRVSVRIGCGEGTLTLAVENDGARPHPDGTGMGLRLAAFEALQRGGVLEFGAPSEGRWRVTLVVPLEGG